MFRYVIAGASLCLVLALAFWFLKNEPTSPVTLQEGERESLAPIVSSTNTERAIGVRSAETRTPSAQIHDSDSRNPVTQFLAGRVVSADGETVVNAGVLWIALTPLDLECEPAWHEDDWGALGRPTLEATTDSSGRFQFDATLDFDPLVGSILWASAPGFVARSLGIGGESEPERRSREIVLERAATIDVLVIDGNGTPVPSARVEHFGLTPRSAEPGNGADVSEERARRFFEESGVTGLDGVVRFGAFPGEQVLRATTSTGCSIPWRGRPTTRVTLHLRESFTVGGVITLPDWSDLEYVGERRITIASRRGNVVKSLAVLRDVREGEWGPATLPRIEGASYSVELTGSPIVPVVETLEPPAAGAHVSVDLHATRGHNVLLAAENQAGELLPDAEGEVWWTNELGQTITLSRRAGTDPESVVNLWSVPTGSFHCRLSAPGYVPREHGPVELPMVPKYTLLLTLKPAGRLAGTCVFEGDAVEDFEVMTWGKVAADRTVQSHTFRGRADGRFEIGTVPRGDVYVVASSESAPPCDPVLIRVTESGTANVTLRLSAPQTGEGALIDSSTREPIRNATYQHMMVGDPVDRATWGPPVSIGGDGDFELSGLRIGINRVRFRAPGYADARIEFETKPSEVTDLGNIALVAAQALTIHLITASDVGTPEGFTATVHEAPELGIPRFSSDGIATFEGVAPGLVGVTIQGIDTPERTTLYANLVPGEEWLVEHQLGGLNELTVDVIEGGGVSLDQIDGVFVRYANSAGMRVESAVNLDESGTARLGGIDAEKIAVVATNFNAEEFASTTGDFAGSDALHLRLDLGGEELRVHVVDPDGKPVPGATVILVDASGTTLQFGERTGPDGRANLQGVPDAPSLVHLYTDARGIRLNAPWKGGGGDLKLELRADGRLQLVVADGANPVIGADMTIIDLAGQPLTDPLRTDPTGFVERAKLAPATYTVRLTHPDYWNVETEAEALVDARPTQVQMRALGDLELRVENDEGIPVAGIAVELVSIEFGEAVSTWLESGRVRGDGLRTDASGKLFVRRMPRGEYRWSIRMDGRNDTGTLVVPSSRVARETIRLGD